MGFDNEHDVSGTSFGQSSDHEKMFGMLDLTWLFREVFAQLEEMDRQAAWVIML